MKHLTLVKKLLLIVLLGVLGICGILWMHRFPAANKPALHTAAPPASMVGPNTNAITNNALKAASANSNVSVSRPLNPYQPVKKQVLFQERCHDPILWAASNVSNISHHQPQSGVDSVLVIP